MGKYNHSINASFIENEDKHNRICRNMNLPPAKDTIQIPQGGYAILNVPLDTGGAWIMHCHINQHMIAGMAMVLQIGKADAAKEFGRAWCDDPFKEIMKHDYTCKIPPTSMDIVYPAN